jgi:hypothetical protein
MATDVQSFSANVFAMISLTGLSREGGREIGFIRLDEFGLQYGSDSICGTP